MSTKFDTYEPTHPGASTFVDPRYMHEAISSVSVFEGAPSRPASKLFGKMIHYEFGGAVPYTTVTASGAQYPITWTIDDDAAGGAPSVGYSSGGQFVLTPDNVANAQIRGKGMELIPVFSNITAGKPMRHQVHLRLACSDVANIGFGIGIGVNASAGVNMTDAEHADFVCLRKGIAAATVIGCVRGNAGTRADTGTIATMVNGTMVEMGMNFKIGFTAAETNGYFYVNGVRTVFSAAQKQALFDMMTTPLGMASFFHLKVNNTAQPTITLLRGWAMTDLLGLSTVD